MAAMLHRIGPVPGPGWLSRKAGLGLVGLMLCAACELWGGGKETTAPITAAAGARRIVGCGRAASRGGLGGFKRAFRLRRLGTGVERLGRAFTRKQRDVLSHELDSAVSQLTQVIGNGKGSRAGLVWKLGVAESQQQADQQQPRWLSTGMRGWDCQADLAACDASRERC